MSYLIENSLVVHKKEYEEDEAKYSSYESYPLGEYLILTENDRPFFSLYDIANYCKKHYKNDKLFLIAHRYFDQVENEKITEFYIFNTLNIFEKSLTSFLYIKENELDAKQKVVQNNIYIAKKLLDCDNLHIILGDNIKEHEVVEYITVNISNSTIDLFDKNELQISQKQISFDAPNYKTPDNIKSTRISTILNSIRVLEPKNNRIKKILFLFIVIIISVYSAEDIINLILDDYKSQITKNTKVLEKKYSNLKENNYVKQKNLEEMEVELMLLKQKPIFSPELKNETINN